MEAERAIRIAAACLYLMSCREKIQSLLHLLVGRLVGWSVGRMIGSGAVCSKYEGGYAIQRY